jgi:CHAT domain-containing protein
MSTQQPRPSIVQYMKTALSLHATYERSGNRSMLDSALQVWNSLITHSEFPAASVEVRAATFQYAAQALLQRYQHTGNPQDLDMAESLLRQAVDWVLPGDPLLAPMLENLTTALAEKFTRTSNVRYLNEAIELGERSLLLIGIESTSRFYGLNNLASSLRQRYELTAEEHDLDRAIVMLEEALGLTEADTRTRAVVARNLGRCLRQRYSSKKQIADLEYAAKLTREAALVTELPTGERAIIMGSLGNLLLETFQQRGGNAYLDEAIQVHHQAVAKIPTTSPHFPALANDLGNALVTRFKLSYSKTDLQDALDTYRQGLENSQQSTAIRSALLGNLGRCLYDAYTRTREIQLLDEAITIQREAASSWPETSENGISEKRRLHRSLRDSFEANGDPLILDEAISLLEQLISVTTTKATIDPDDFSYLGICYGLRWGRSRQSIDLDRSVLAYHQAIGKSAVDSPELAGYYSNLGITHRRQYEQHGDLSALSQAIQMCKFALNFADAKPSVLVRSRVNYATCLQARYQHSKDLVDLEAAIRELEAALNEPAINTLEQPSYLTNLAAALLLRFDAIGEISDLDKAVGILKHAVQVGSQANWNGANVQMNLGLALYLRYRHNRNVEDLDEAIALLASCVGGKDYPQIDSLVAYYLGITHKARFEHVNTKEELQSGISYLRLACEVGADQRVFVVLQAAREWGNWAIERSSWAEAAEAYSHGLSSIGQLVPLQIVRATKETWLREAQQIPRRLAFALAKLGKAADAVVALEKGRALLLSESLERSRINLQRLEDHGHRDLYQTYLDLAERLSLVERADIDSSQKRVMPVGAPDLQGLREVKTTRDELARIVAAIRQVPNYEAFLTTPNIEEIMSVIAGEMSAVAVYLCCSPAGGVALLVSVDGVQSIDFNLSEEDFIHLLFQPYDRAYFLAQLGKGSMIHALDEILPILGKRVIGPVASALREYCHKAHLARLDVTLIPTSGLGVLPLHAAQYELSGKRSCLSEEFVISYSPSARAIGQGRQILDGSQYHGATLLGIANPYSSDVDGLPLSFVEFELTNILEWFDQESMILQGETTRPEQVMTLMESFSHLHFACHAEYNPVNPLHSGIVLGDHSLLMLKDLLSRPMLRNVRLAVLSACQTAVTGFIDLPEELVGLPVGFLNIGVPGILGTLWLVKDLATSLLMMKFYEYHLVGSELPPRLPMSPALALHFAQKWLRQVTNVQLAEFFEQRQSELTTMNHALDSSLVQKQFVKYALARAGDEQPFSHPYYWAPFTFHGV